MSDKVEETLAYVVGKNKLDTINGDKKNKAVHKTTKKPEGAANTNRALKLVKNESAFDRIKRIAGSKNKAIMERYEPVSPSELAFWNSHIVVNHKNLEPGVTDNDEVFNATNISGPAKRRADKVIKKDDKPGTSSASDIYKPGSTTVVPEESDPSNFKDAVLEDAIKGEKNKNGKTLMHGHNGSSVVDSKTYKLKSHVHELGSGKWAHDHAEKGKVHHFDSKEKAVKHMMRTHGFHESIAYVDVDLNEDALSRLRVQRAKLKKKLQGGNQTQDDLSKLLSLNTQIKNLNRANKVRDEWAAAAERNLEDK